MDKKQNAYTPEQIRCRIPVLRNGSDSFINWRSFPVLNVHFIEGNIFSQFWHSELWIWKFSQKSINSIVGSAIHVPIGNQFCSLIGAHVLFSTCIALWVIYLCYFSEKQILSFRTLNPKLYLEFLFSNLGFDF